jgi:hypothetical protein
VRAFLIAWRGSQTYAKNWGLTDAHYVVLWSCGRESPGTQRGTTTMAVTVRTQEEARAAGLKVPQWAEGHDDLLLGHHDDDGNVAVWGKDRSEVERLAKAFD